MPEQLEAELSLDLAQANRDIDALGTDIEQAFSAAVDSFSEQFTSAVRDIGTVDIPVDAATDDLQNQLALAFDGFEPPPIEPQVDIDGLEQQLSFGIAGLEPPPVDVSVQAEFGDAIEQAAALAEGLDNVSFAAGDASDALAQVGQDGGAGFDQINQQSRGAAEGALELGGASTLLGTSFKAARGQGEGLVESLKELPAGFGAAVAGGAALTAGFVGLFEAGDKSLAAIERVKVILGDMADEIEHIDIGGLTGDLSKLAIQAGSSAAGLRNAAASAAQMGISSGATKREVVDFSEKVNALALRAVVLNPRLGDAGTAAERLNLILGRGGRFLARYGIDLNAAEINARALADTQKTAVKDLTLFEKASAGAAIATEKLGDKLGSDFARGAEQSSVQLKSLRAEMNAAFAAAGRPLVQPTIDALRSLTPIAIELSTVLGELGTAALPALAGLFEALGLLAKPLGLLAEGLSHIPGPLLALTVGFLGFRALAGPIGNLLGALGGQFDAVGNAAGRIGAPVEFAGKGLGALGGAARENQANFAAAAVGLTLFASSLHGLGQNVTDTATGIGGLALAGSQIGLIFGEPVLGAALGAAAGGIIALGKSMFDTHDDAKQLQADIEDITKALHGLGDTAAARAFGEQVAGSAAKASAAFTAINKDTGAFAKNYSTAFGQASLSTAEAERIVARFDSRFAALAAKNPAEAKRVRDGLASIGDAVPQKELERLDVLLDKGTTTAARHAKNIREDAAANDQLTGATAGSTSAVDQQATALESANKKLADYVAFTKDGKDAASDLAKELAGQLAPHLDDIGHVFDDLLGATQKFGGELATPDVTAYTKTLTETTDATSRWVNTVQSLFDQGLTGLASLVLQRGPSISKPLIDEINNSGPEQKAAWDQSLTEGFVAFAQAQEESKHQGELLSTKAAEGIKANPDDLLDAMKSKLGGLVRFSDEVRSLIAEGNTAIAAQLLGLGADAAQKYIDGLQQKTPEQRAALNAGLVATKETLDATQQTIADETVNVANQAGTLSEKLTAAYQSHLFEVPKDSDEALQQAEAVIRGHDPTFYRAGHGTGESATHGIGDGITAAQGAADDATNGIAFGLTFLAPNFHGTGEQLGQSIMDGITAGLNSDAAAREQQQAIDEALDALDAAARDHIGATSPAKAFMPLGHDIAAGIGVGIVKGMGAVRTDLASSLDTLGGGTYGAFGSAPAPPEGAAVWQFGPGALGSTSMSDDHSIHVHGGIHNYGPDKDSRASATTRKFRSFQFMNAGV